MYLWLQVLQQKQDTDSQVITSIGKLWSSEINHCENFNLHSDSFHDNSLHYATFIKNEHLLTYTSASSLSNNVK